MMAETRIKLDLRSMKNIWHRSKSESEALLVLLGDGRRCELFDGTGSGTFIATWA